MRNLILAIVLSVSLVACGGGGGGSSSGGSDGGSSSGVRIMHAGLDVSPLDLHSSTGDKVLQSARFAEVKSYSSIAKGAQVISALRRFSTNAVFSASSLDYQGGKHSLLIFGGIELGNDGAVLISDGVSEIPEGSGMVRVVNGVIGSSPIVAQIAGATTGSAGFASAGTYVAIPAGEYDFSVREVSGGNFDLGTISVEDGRAYSILVAGQDAYFSTSSVFRD